MKKVDQVIFLEEAIYYDIKWQKVRIVGILDMRRDPESIKRILKDRNQ